MEYENTAGSLKISSEVVASIAEYAVKEVEGVACLAPIVSNIGGWLLEKQTIKPISIQMLIIMYSETSIEVQIPRIVRSFGNDIDYPPDGT